MEPREPSPASKAPKHGKRNPTVKELEEQVEKLTDLAARAQADLQNFKARIERDRESLRKFVAVPFVLNLLPIRDDLHRAATAHPNDQGYRQILEKFDKVFGEVGVVRIEALGKPFDSQKHEVLNTGPGAKDVVTAVHEEGYELHGKVLRPAKVQVGDGTL